MLQCWCGNWYISNDVRTTRDVYKMTGQVLELNLWLDKKKTVSFRWRNTSNYGSTDFSCSLLNTIADSDLKLLKCLTLSFYAWILSLIYFMTLKFVLETQIPTLCKSLSLKRGGEFGLVLESIALIFSLTVKIKMGGSLF